MGSDATARAERLDRPACLPVVGRASGPRLSKSRFVAGQQCHRRLWWTVHDPQARELIPDDGLAARLELGRRVGERAREHVPGGVLIRLDPAHPDDAIQATARALASGARVIYEACFAHAGVFVAVDVLERRPEGLVVIEVKSTLSVKPGHLADAAVQTWVARGAGHKIARTEIMHLDRRHRHGEDRSLFVRVDVTREVEELVPRVDVELERQRNMLTGTLPHVQVGEHCHRPHACPFVARCWPRLPSDHVSELYCLSPERVVELEAQGYRSIRQLPGHVELNPVAARQRRAVRSRQVVVEPGLAPALAELCAPLAFLDFETVMPALPAWPGCAPYETVPVQFSVHLERDGRLEHRAWLAERDADPREPVAVALLHATAGVRHVLAWHAPFEEQQLLALARAVPRLSAPLQALAGRLVDLLPIVRRHVYHPDFHGSFSLKKVLPALVPELGYDDLAISDGLAASRALENLLLPATRIDEATQARLRRDLLRYCERDTVGLVRLVRRLRELAGSTTVAGE